MNGDRALAKKLKDGVQDLEKELNEANSKLKTAKNTVALVEMKLKNYVTLEDDLRTMPGSLLLKPIESLLKELKGHLCHEKRNGSKDLSKLAEDLQAKQFKDRIEDLEKELNETNSKLESANEIVPFIEKELKYFLQLPFPYRMDHREAGNEGVYQYLFLNFLDLFRLLNGQLGDGEHNGSEVKLLKNRIQDLEKELNEANSKLESANAKLTTANLERANERAAAAEKKLEDCHMRGAEKIHQWDLTTNLVAQCIKELEGRFKDRFECLENDLKDFFPWLKGQPGDGECNCSEGESDEEKEAEEDKDEEEDKEEDEDEDEDEDTVLVDGPASDGSPSPHS